MKKPTKTHFAYMKEIKNIIKDVIYNLEGLMNIEYYNTDYVEELTQDTVYHLGVVENILKDNNLEEIERLNTEVNNIYDYFGEIEGMIEDDRECIDFGYTNLLSTEDFKTASTYVQGVSDKLYRVDKIANKVQDLTLAEWYLDFIKKRNRRNRRNRKTSNRSKRNYVGKSI